MDQPFWENAVFSIFKKVFLLSRKKIFFRVFKINVFFNLKRLFFDGEYRQTRFSRLLFKK